MFTRLTHNQISKKIDYIEQYCSSGNAADSSIVDSNANVSSKNISTMEAELNKDINIQINREMLRRRIEKMFGEELSREYIRQLEDHEIYTHDESSTKPYCASISMYPFLLDGMTNLGGESKAPKHLESFCGAFPNLIFAVSSQFAGAIATVEFLNVFDYYARKDYGDDYLSTHEDRIANHLQQVVYILNEPAGSRGFQSTFWNISIFDKYYFESMFGDFHFPDGSSPSWESLEKLQVYFLEWFNKEREKALLTFPVITAAILTENGEPKDVEFADKCAKNMSEGGSFFVYMSESADSLASCCLDGSEFIEIEGKHGVTYYLTLESVYNQYKDTIIRAKHKDIFVEAIPVKLKGRPLFEIQTNNASIKVTDNHINPTQRGDIVTTELVVGEDSLLYYREDGTECFEKITDILKLDTPDYVYCLEIQGDNEPYFTLPNGIITHNCRLRNQLTDNIFSYSLGAGGVATGSVNVITLNFNRMVQDGRDLATEISKIHKYQAAYRSIIVDFKEAGILPVYDLGFVALSKQFMTIGINGMVEAAEYLGIKPTNNPEYIKFLQDNLKVIFDLNKKAGEEFGFMFNTEFVPAENLGVKNAKWDKKDGYVVNRECYNSYFYPVESNENNLIDKFVLHGGDVIKYLDGGSALHLNLDEIPTQESYVKLFNIAAKLGCNYWTTNIKSTICETCGNIDKNTLMACPKCGSKDISYATRVIGYLKKVSSFSSDRQNEENMRYYGVVK